MWFKSLGINRKTCFIFQLTLYTAAFYNLHPFKLNFEQLDKESLISTCETVSMFLIVSSLFSSKFLIVKQTWLHPNSSHWIFFLLLCYLRIILCLYIQLAVHCKFQSTVCPFGKCCWVREKCTFTNCQLVCHLSS